MKRHDKGKKMTPNPIYAKMFFPKSFGGSSSPKSPHSPVSFSHLSPDSRSPLAGHKLSPSTTRIQPQTRRSPFKSVSPQIQSQRKGKSKVTSPLGSSRGKRSHTQTPQQAPYPTQHKLPEEDLLSALDRAVELSHQEFQKAKTQLKEARVLDDQITQIVEDVSSKVDVTLETFHARNTSHVQVGVVEVLSMQAYAQSTLAFLDQIAEGGA